MLHLTQPSVSVVDLQAFHIFLDGVSCHDLLGIPLLIEHLNLGCRLDQLPELSDLFSLEITPHILLH